MIWNESKAVALGRWSSNRRWSETDPEAKQDFLAWAACHYSCHDEVESAREAVLSMASELGLLSGEEFFVIKVDMENNAEEFWEACQAEFPRLANCLAHHGAVFVTEEVYQKLAALPGFADGPAHACKAVVKCDSSGEEYLSIAASRAVYFAVAN